jgi:hypothetical protein
MLVRIAYTWKRKAGNIKRRIKGETKLQIKKMRRE